MKLWLVSDTFVSVENSRVVFECYYSGYRSIKLVKPFTKVFVKDSMENSSTLIDINNDGEGKAYALNWNLLLTSLENIKYENKKRNSLGDLSIQVLYGVYFTFEDTIDCSWLKLDHKAFLVYRNSS